MLPYYLLIGIPLVFAFCYELYYERIGKRGKKKNYTIIVFFIIYFLLLAFRNKNIGSDVPIYLEHFEYVSKSGWTEILARYRNSDIGYFIFNKLLVYISQSGQMLLAAIAAITTFPMAYLYYKESGNALVSISLFMVMPIFQMNFSGLRQAIAISFVVPAYYCAQNKEIKKFLLTGIIATLFHSSAFVIFFIYPIYHYRVNKKHMIIFFPLVLIAYRFNAQIYMLLVRLLGEEYQKNYGYVTETGAYTMLYVYIAFTIYAFIFTSESDYSLEEKSCRNFMLVALCLQIFTPVNSIAMRMNYYYIPFIPLIVSQATNKLRINSNLVKCCISVLIYVIFTWYYLDKSLSIDSLNIYPYEIFYR